MQYLGRDLILPSAQSAADFIDGNKGSLLGVIGCTAFRAGLLSIGLLAVGFRKKQLIKGIIAGSIAIETFILGYAVYDKNKYPQSV